MDCSAPGFPVLRNLQSLLKLMSTELVMPSNHLILCRPLLFLSSIFSSIRVFSKGLALCIKWPENYSFNLSISPSNEHSGLISFRIDWFDLAVQGSLKSLLQHHSSKTSNLWHSAFFMVQLSYPYMTTGETIALTRWTFAGKVMSLLFNMLSRLITTFLPRSSSVQLLSHVQLFRNPWTTAYKVSLFITNSQSLLKLMFIDTIQISHPLLSPSPAFSLSQHQGLFQ